MHLAYRHPASTMLEYIPWIRDWLVEPIAVKDGCFALPQNPGAGTTMRADALAKVGKALG